MKNIVYEQLEKAEKDYRRFYEVGNYYYEQENYTQALANYVGSFSAYASYMECAERATLVQGIEDFHAGVRSSIPSEVSYTIKQQIDFYFNVCIQLLRIMNCSNQATHNRLIEAYIIEKVKIIFDTLSNYQKDFDVEDIKNFNSIAQCINLKSNLIAKNKEELESIKKVKPEQEQNETLKEIRNALQIISGTKICVISLELTTNSGCFIATAAYSTSIHPDLDTFRNFRDKKLLTNAVGKQLVNLYYQIGPSIAKYVEKQPVIKNFLRHQLGRLAEWMRNQRVKNY
ncbi:MAG: CFI-box-CTERM domain-containing protein [Phormidium sp.]